MTSTPSDLTCVTRSVAETAALGRQLGEVAEPGLVVALVGNLGAGKTAFVKGVAQGLEIDPRGVNSPTFTLVHEYEGRLPLYHFDVYRLRGGADVLALGADEYFHGAGVSCVEWADRAPDAFPADVLQVAIETVDESSRQFEFRGTGPRSHTVLAALRRALGSP